MAIIDEGTIGESGAPWRLYDTKLLEIDAGSIDWTETVSPWDDYRDAIEHIVFTGPITAGPSISHLFFGLTKVSVIDGLSNFVTISVTNMSGVFSGVQSVTTLNLNTNSPVWDTSSVMNMSRMFENTTELVNLNTTGWNTGSVIDMSGMFSGAMSLTTLNVSSWNTSSVADMSDLFKDTNSLKSLDVSSWDTSLVTNMSNMFSGARSLTALNVRTSGSAWDVSSVTNMSGMFASMWKLQALNIDNWDTSSVKDMSFMFYNTNSLTGLNITHLNTSAVEEMGWMFYNTENLTSLNLSHFDTESVEDMSYLLGKTTSLSNLTLGESFSFKTNCTNASLPPVAINRKGTDVPEFTGYWQNVGSGTPNNPTGPHVLTSQLLMAQYTGSTMADTYVWQKRPNLIRSIRMETTYNGVIDQTAQTISFTGVPPTQIINGYWITTIGALTADSTPVYFCLDGTISTLGVNSSIRFTTGDLAYANNGRVYTLMIN